MTCHEELVNQLSIRMLTDAGQWDLCLGVVDEIRADGGQVANFAVKSAMEVFLTSG